MLKVGFLGLGQMGTAIAERLESVGVTLHLHDPRPSAMAVFVTRGAVAHDTVRAVADRAEIVFASLPDPATSLAVAGEVAAGSCVATYVETSTIGRGAMMKIRDVLAANGIDLIDAPVSGGPLAAQTGTLAMLVAGAATATARVRPLIDAVAGRLFFVGDTPGAAQTMKLINNLTAAGLAAVTREAMAMGRLAGLDAATMTAVLDASSGQSSVTSLLMRRHVLTESFDFGATVSTLVKDIDLALFEGNALGASTPLAEGVAATWRAACDRLGSNSDLTRFFEERA